VDLAEGDTIAMVPVDFIVEDVKRGDGEVSNREAFAQAAS
jgi:hypothetical protein